MSLGIYARRVSNCLNRYIRKMTMNVKNGKRGFSYYLRRIIPDMEEMTITEAERSPWLSSPACNKGRRATVVNLQVSTLQFNGRVNEPTYIAHTLVLNVSDHSETVSPLNSLSFNSEVFSLSGSAFGPEIPAFVIRRLM
jgi:hypothetical protein